MFFLFTEYMYRIYPEKDATENDYEYIPIMLPSNFFSGSNPQPSNIRSQQHTLQFDMRGQQQVINGPPPPPLPPVPPAPPPAPPPPPPPPFPPPPPQPSNI